MRHIMPQPVETPAAGPRLLAAGCVAVLALAALAVGAEPPLVVPVDGQPFRAQLSAIDPNWQLEFDPGGKPRRLPVAQLVRWGKCAEPAQGPIVMMADGGLLVADVLGTDKERLKVDSSLFGLVDLPLERLAGVVFDLPAQRHRRDLLLDRIARAAGESDRLLLHNGDELTGLVEAIGNATVRLGTGDKALEIKTDAIAALVFNPLLRKPPGAEGPRAWAGLADGSRLIATRLLADGASLRLTTAGGQTWKTSPKELVFVQPLGGRVTYLSELKPAGYRHVPYLSLPWPYRTDRNVTGGRLRCGGRLYLYGLGMHSAARLTYRLDKPYRRFQAELGIDDATKGGGSVRFRVFVDGRQKYTSPTIRGGAAPVPVSVDLDGAKRLDLVVDYADRADQLDRADWLDARVVSGE